MWGSVSSHSWGRKKAGLGVTGLVLGSPHGLCLTPASAKGAPKPLSWNCCGILGKHLGKELRGHFPAALSEPFQASSCAGCGRRVAALPKPLEWQGKIKGWKTLSKAFSHAWLVLLNPWGTAALRRGYTKEGWDIVFSVGCAAKSSSMVWQRMETHP